jgi:hypothetical protein
MRKWKDMESSEFKLLESRFRDKVITKQEYIENMHRLHYGNYADIIWNKTIV